MFHLRPSVSSGYFFEREKKKSQEVDSLSGRIQQCHGCCRSHLAIVREGTQRGPSARGNVGFELSTETRKVKLSLTSFKMQPLTRKFMRDTIKHSKSLEL